MRALARAVRSVWRRLRFELWKLRLRFELARQGGSLEIEAPNGLAFDGFPVVKTYPNGTGSATTRIRIGRGVHLGRGVTIEIAAHGDNTLELGDETTFLDGVRVALRGGTWSTGPECLVRDGVWVKVDGVLAMGREVTLSHHAAVHCSESIILEDFVGLGERVSVLDSEHTFDGSDTHYMSKPITTEPVRIGSNSMVAIGAVVLMGATLGPNSVVAANSVVRRGDYPRGAILGGIPAKVLRTLGPEEEPIDFGDRPRTSA